jgi:hypothetical protein
MAILTIQIRDLFERNLNRSFLNRSKQRERRSKFEFNAKAQSGEDAKILKHLREPVDA